MNKNNIPSASANAYKQQQVLTATPEQLILMLYNGCIKFMNDAAKAMDEKNIEKAHNACIKSQNIVTELISSLNMDYPISKELSDLYEYVSHEIAVANVKKDPQHLENAKEVIINIREGWVEAMKTARAQGAAPQSQKVSGDSAISI